MSDLLRHGRAAFVGVALAALFAACSGSASTSPTAVASTAPAGSSIAGKQALPAPSAGAASSDGGGPASSVEEGEACAIVTKDAVSEAMGYPVALVAGVGLTCTFQTADSGHYLAITLYHSQADMAQMLQIEPGSEHTAGLGDDAFYTGTGILFVRQGDHAIEISDPDLAGSAADTAPRDALITLARTALPKL